MSGCLSWSSSGQEGVITRAIMSWVRKPVQQVDKTVLRVGRKSRAQSGLPKGQREPGGRPRLPYDHISLNKLTKPTAHTSWRRR
jgi:hypothetical protein